MATEPSGHARIVYKDDRGTHTFLVTKDEIVIGRQAPDVWADLSLDTSLDVSREHARLQRTPEGVFRIKDLSKLGTTVNGVPAAPQPGGRGRRRQATSTAGSRCRTRRASASPA